MNVTMHFPEDEKNKEYLSKKISKVYADIIKIYIENLNCNKNQKLKLINSIIETKKSEIT